MLCSRFLSREHAGAARPLLPGDRARLPARRCGSTSARLAWVMDHRRAALAVLARASWSAPCVLFTLVPKGFIPSEDTGQHLGTTETAEGTSFDAMVQPPAGGRRDRRGGSERRRRSCRRSAAAAAAPPTNQGRLIIRLKPRRERALDADEVDPRSCSPKLARGPGHPRLPAEPAGRSTSAGGQSKSQYQFTLQGADIDALYDSAARARAAAARRCPQLHGRHQRPADQEPAGPGRRSTATAPPRSASTPAQIEEALYDAYGSRQVSTIYTANNQYWVIMELLPAVPARPDGARACSTCARPRRRWCRSARWRS